MKRFLTLLSVVLAPLFLSMPPGLAEVQNVDFSRFEVPKVSGRDRSLPGATLATKQAAIDEAVYTLFAQTEGERARYQACRAQVMAKLGDYVQDFRVLDKDRQDGDVILEASATILRAPLKSRLTELGVIATETGERGSDRPRLLTLLAIDGQNRDLAEFAVSRINDYLSKQHVEVVDTATVRELLEGDAAIAGTSAPSVELSLKSQADLILKVSATVERTRSFGDHDLFQAKVSLQANVPFSDEPVEAKTYTSRELTFLEAGDRDKAKRAAIEEAVGGAIEPLSLALTKAWKESADQGHPYRFRLKGSSLALRAALLQQLEQKGKLVRQDAGTAETSYVVRFRGKLEDLLETVVDALDPRLQVESETTSEVILTMP